MENSYKLDWLTFSIDQQNDRDENGKPFMMMRELGYDLEEFEPANARMFYNTALTLSNYVNVYYNDPKKTKIKGSSDTVTYLFTGQGCIDLLDRLSNNVPALFQLILGNGGKVTRLDIAYDDFQGLLDFNVIIDKLTKGHYVSSKKSYNIVRGADAKGRQKSLTIYVGSARSSGSKGNHYLRMYDKYAQSIEKKVVLPNDIKEAGIWQRYEISYSKAKANEIAEKIAEGETVDYLYKTTLRNIIEFLSPRKTSQGKNYENKAEWYRSAFWERFLEFDEKMKFESHESRAELSALLEWLQVSVMPNLKNAMRIAEEHDIDFHELIDRFIIRDNEFSKKQERLYKSYQLKKVRSNYSADKTEKIKEHNEKMTVEVKKLFNSFRDKKLGKQKR